MDIYWIIGSLIGGGLLFWIAYIVLERIGSILGGMLLLSLRGIYLIVTEPPQTNPKQGRLNHISSTDNK